MRRNHLPFWILLAACDTLTPDGGGPDFEGVRVTDEGNGVFQLEIDASDKEAWVYFDLGSWSQVEAPADLDTSLDWDLGFRRYFVKSNGGASGPGTVRVSPLPGVAFEELVRAPVSGWIQDRPQEVQTGNAPAEVIRDDVDFAFNRKNEASDNGWYLYESVEHTLSPAPLIYAVESLAGRFYKVQFLRYYDDAGSPAILTLRAAEIERKDDQ